MELAWSLIFWFAFSSPAYLLMILAYEDFINQDIATLSGICLVLARNTGNLAVVVISCLRNTVPFDTPDGAEADPDCLTRVEKVLAAERPLTYFVGFLSSRGPEGIALVRAFTLIKEFEEAADQETDAHKTIQKAREVLGDLSAGVRDLGLKEETMESIGQTLERGEPDKHLFDQAYGVVINQLQGLLQLFRETEQYAQMARELESRSIITQRMRSAKLIE